MLRLGQALGVRLGLGMGLELELGLVRGLGLALVAGLELGKQLNAAAVWFATFTPYLSVVTVATVAEFSMEVENLCRRYTPRRHATT